MAGETRAKAAATTPKEKGSKKDDVRADNAPIGTHPDAVAGPARTTEDIDAERRRVQPHAVSGPAAGNRLLHAPERNDDGELQEQKEADLESITSTDEATAMVTVGADVYEEVPAPGAPGRYIQRLLYRKGRQVRKSELDRALQAQRKAKSSGDETVDAGDGGATT